MKTDATDGSDGTARKVFGRGWPRVVLVVVVVIAGLLLILRVALPSVVTHALNRKLGALPEYRGSVSDVDLEIWRGVIHVKNFKLETRKTPADGVVAIPGTRLAVAWRPLFHGKLGGQAVIENAELVVFNDEAIQEEKVSQKEEKHEETKERVETVKKVEEWQQVLREAFPLNLSRFEMRDGRVRFVDRTMNPPPEVVLEHVGLVVTGLTNRPENKEELPATLTLDGMVKTGGHVFVGAQINPVADKPRFEAHLKVDGLELPPLNDFTRFYGKADVQSGRFTVFIAVNARGGYYQGYLKPFFEGLHFKAVPEEKNVLKRAATAVASAVTSALKSDKGKVATQISIQGNFADNDVDIWTTIRNLLRNAFVQALREGFAGQKPSD